VTAVALGTTAGYGVVALVNDASANIVLNGRNVIAQGGTVDQFGFSSAGTSHIDLDYSNFSTLEFSGSGATGTDVDSFNNQSAEPNLDANYHQLPGSPTIDGGDSGASLLGSLDIDLDARVQNGAPDIGADEADGVAPETKITEHPRNRTKRRKATFEFESPDADAAGFQCKLDGKPFKPCNSGEIKYKRLKRKKHKFRVRAVDGFGNVDASPDRDSWKIRKRR
jgi:hypothetical protein